MQVGSDDPPGMEGRVRRLGCRRGVAAHDRARRDGEALGFESLWLFDHFHTVPDPTDEITFESFSSLAAIAMVTSRVRLGHMVVCTSFRNPGLTAKLTSTLDVISGGRFELGIGAGWKEDEWLAYGFGFPPIGQRMDVFEEHLEVITRMLAPGHATFEGKHAQVRDAINEPKGIQDHIPVIVGGNGRERTAGLAVRFADELNFVYLTTDEVRVRMAEVRATLRASGPRPVHDAVLAVRRGRGGALPGAGTHRHPGWIRRRRPRPGRVLSDALGSDHRRPGALRGGLPRRRTQSWTPRYR